MAVSSSGPSTAADSGPETEGSNTAADSPLAITAAVAETLMRLATLAATSYRLAPSTRLTRWRTQVPLSPRRLRRLSPSMVALAPAAEVAVATSTPLPAVRSRRSSFATSDRPKAEASEPR